MTPFEPLYKEERFIVNGLEITVRGKFTEIEIEVDAIELPEGIDELVEPKDGW